MNETTPLVVRTGDADGGGGGPAPSSSPLSSPKPPPSAAPPRVRDLAARASTSMRRIGVLGSVSIAANSLTGPAMLCLPATYQRSGLIPTTGETTRKGGAAASSSSNECRDRFFASR